MRFGVKVWRYAGAWHELVIASCYILSPAVMVM